MTTGAPGTDPPGPVRGAGPPVRRPHPCTSPAVRTAARRPAGERPVPREVNQP